MERIVIGSVVAVFVVSTLCGVIALIVASIARKRMLFATYARVTQLATFAVFVGLWGSLVGCMFWIAS
jgi:hypothetical protein